MLVGVTGLELSRADFYEKELSFQVSCSYGPGRYDPSYEDKGHDYPVGYVRWTEQRNFEAVLDLMASGALDLKPLVSHRYGVDEAGKAYDLLASGAPSLGILLGYPERAGEAAASLRARTISLAAAPARPAHGAAPVVGVIGAGNYAGRVLIPAFKRAGATLHTLVSAGGVSAAYHGGKQGFEQASTDAAAVLAAADVDTVVIATRHDSHATYVCRALEAGKHVFVEKPLAVTEHGTSSGSSGTLATSSVRRRKDPLRRQPSPADGRLQPPLRAAGGEDARAARRRPRAQGLRHDGERGRHPARALDAGRRVRRRPHRRRGLPLHRPAAPPRRRADRRRSR